MKKTSFFKWLFEKRDVDGLVIGFLISAAVNAFIKDFTLAVVDPIIYGMLPSSDKSEDTEQVLNINDYMVIRFKLQYLLSGTIRLLITLLLAYLIVKYLYQFFSLD
jgi:large-conductance mechanosensitive channel